MVLYTVLNMGLKTFAKTRKLSSVTFPFNQFCKSLGNTSLDNKFLQADHMQLLPLCMCCLREDVRFCNHVKRSVCNSANR